MKKHLQAKYEELPEHYKLFVDQWGSEIVYHTQIPQFFQGGLSTGRVANLLSAGEGPEVFRIGHKKASYAVDLVHWLWRRSEKPKGGVVACNGEGMKAFNKLENVPASYHFVYRASDGEILRSATLNYKED